MPAVFLYAGDGPWWLAPLLFFIPLILPNLLRPFTALGYLLGELLLPVSLLPGRWVAIICDTMPCTLHRTINSDWRGGLHCQGVHVMMAA